MFTTDTCCILGPYAQVPAENLAVFKALGSRCLKKIRNEPGNHR